MPHLFTNRPRLASVGSTKRQRSIDVRWEFANALLYELGGVLFMVGSVFFFPSLEHLKDIGAWLFFVGSLVYLIVLLHDMVEVHRFWPKQKLSPSRTLEVVAIWAYLLGTILFTVGSLLFLSWIDWVKIGAWTFVVGSALFVIGASVNVMMVIRASSLMTLQLMNLTAVMFVVGSGLFVVASIPYLWEFESPAAKAQTLAFLAWLFLIGSGFFLVGGLFNHQRSRLVIRYRLDAIAKDEQADERLLAFLRGEISEIDYRSSHPLPNGS
ncbi:MULTISPECIES: YrhK family protein [Larsenimonas]|uniref:YrhK family protein n=1 Tax=Larsenimonas suaedae TaxID=1851019 RepID=A0ABU1GTV2_9GAMM|nr:MULTISPECIES: YrhK family protein [Larsenimonas]MCM2972182.1 YrhK family protein [Larsenimonas suaedae]MCM5704261.1 YrhK family protein [Larsenimonas salina]MDR5895022.1 YrhK family protein [Larsenimonas suaedae]